MGSIAAVTVALVQTGRANRAAQAAEARADRDIQRRRERDLRVEEHESVYQIMKAVSLVLSEVSSFARFIEVQEQLTEAVRKSESTGNQKESFITNATLMVEERQRSVHKATNDAITDTRVALFRIVNQSIIAAATEVLRHMNLTRMHYSTPGRPNDWTAAEQAAEAMNQAALELQTVADYRFRMADDNVPNPERPQ